ncbi:MFS transporter [Chloroflexota bacterium]
MIKKVFPILGLAIFSSMLGNGIVSPLLPLYAESLGATGVGVGIIFAGFSIANAISTPIFGRLSDRNGRKSFISVGLFIYAIISLGFIWASSVYQLALMRFLHGAAGGMVLPIAQAYIGDVCPRGEEGKWMGYASAAFFTGFGLGPLMGGVLTEHLGMNVAFIAMGSFNILAFFIVVFLLPEAGRKEVTIAPTPSFRKAGGSSMVRGLFFTRLAFAFGRAAFMVFLPIFATIWLGLSPAFVGVLLATNVLLMSLLGIPSGKLADKFSRRSLVCLGSIINFASLALIPLTHDFWQVMALSVLGSLGGAISLPAASALTIEEGRKFGMGSVIALFNIAFSIGMAVGPILSGAIYDFADINLVFYFGAAMGFGGTGLFFWFTRRAWPAVEPVIDEANHKK